MAENALSYTIFFIFFIEYPEETFVFSEEKSHFKEFLDYINNAHIYIIVTVGADLSSKNCCGDESICRTIQAFETSA